jgi:lambda family phage portal protein
MNPNWLDRFVAAVSPEAALRRELARSQLAQIATLDARRSQHEIRRAGYEGAKLGGRISWSAGNHSANAEISSALTRLRARSRDLVRNNPYAARAMSALAGNAVGTGFALKLPKAAQPYWQNWTEYADAEGQLDYYGLQNLVARTVFESGECLVRTRMRMPEDGLEIPMQLQVMEPDYLDETKFGDVAGGGWIWGGIEFDALGRRAAYWLYPEHPGEVASFRRRDFQSKRVPAEFVQHIYEKQRPGQARGVPRLAASMLRLRDLDDYEEAELVRKGYEACFMAIVIGKDGSRTLGQTAVDPQTGQRVESITAGMIAYMDDAQDVRFGQPSPMGGYAEYTRAHLHAIAAGTGLTYEQMTGDLSQVNFSSARVGLIEFRRLIEVWQWLTFVPMHATRTVRAWERSARIAGKVRGKPLELQWTPPKWDYIDPGKEVSATRDEIAGGLASLSEKLRARGFDPEKVFAEIGGDVTALSEAAGIPRELVFQILFQPKAAAPAPEPKQPQPGEDNA